MNINIWITYIFDYVKAWLYSENEKKNDLIRIDNNKKKYYCCRKKIFNR